MSSYSIHSFPRSMMIPLHIVKFVDKNDKLSHQQPTPYAILGEEKKKEKDNYF